MNDLHRQVELLMENWTEHSKTGMHVRMLIGPDDADYFKGCPQGQRFVAMMIRLTDDDRPAAPPTPDEVAKEVKKRTARGVAEAGGTVVDQATFDKAIAKDFPLKSAVDTELVQRAIADQRPDWEAERVHKAKFPDGLCGLAVMWCGAEEFHDWLAGTYPDEWEKAPDAPDDERAKGVICRMCGVTTRKDLDTFKEAGVLFHQQFREPYRAHLESLGVDPL
jgi:hypothetical protein